MIINIIIEPVSGSKKVRIEGIKVIIVNVMNVLFLIVKLLKSSIKLNFVSSLGWNEKLNICIHALDPFITLPNIKTYISSTKLIMYMGIMNFFRYWTIYDFPAGKPTISIVGWKQDFEN